MSIFMLLLLTVLLSLLSSRILLPLPKSEASRIFIFWLFLNFIVIMFYMIPLSCPKDPHTTHSPKMIEHYYIQSNPTTLFVIFAYFYRKLKSYCQSRLCHLPSLSLSVIVNIMKRPQRSRCVCLNVNTMAKTKSKYTQSCFFYCQNKHCESLCSRVFLLVWFVSRAPTSSPPHYTSLLLRPKFC